MTLDDNERPDRRRTGLFMILALLVIAGGIYYVVQRSKDHAAGADKTAGGGKHGGGAAGGPTPVSVAKVGRGDVHIILNELGTVTPLATVTVRTQIAGTLMAVHFNEGQIVKAGDVLAEIDSRPYQLQLAQYQGQLIKDQAALEEANRDLTRYQLLVAQDSIARQTLDNQVSLVTQDKGAIQVDEANIKTAQLNIEYCHIKAPVSGRVGLRQVDAGNYAQTSDTNGIVVITQLQPISAIFTVPEDNIDSILERMNAGAILPATALDRAQSTTLATGQLGTVDNQIDTSTGTVRLRAMFDNKDNLLFPNQFVNVQLTVNTVANAITIPTSAVQRGQPGTYVYVVQPDDTVKVQIIKLGPAEGEVQSVTDGLTEGETVVSDGADKLKDGAKVLLPGQQPAATPDSKTPDAPRPISPRRTTAIIRKTTISSSRSEPVTSLYPSSRRDVAADGGDFAGGHGGVPFSPAFRPAGG